MTCDEGRLDATGWTYSLANPPFALQASGDKKFKGDPKWEAYKR